MAEADDRAAIELLLALATARSNGDRTTYRQLLREAATEPARSLVLIDTTVRLLLDVAKERAAAADRTSEEFLRLVALNVARAGQGARQRR